MNALLEKLIEQYQLHEKDANEIRKIFSIVSDEKKMNILQNFDYLVQSLRRIDEELYIEQWILFWKALSDMYLSVNAYKKQKEIEEEKQKHIKPKKNDAF